MTRSSKMIGPAPRRARWSFALVTLFILSVATPPHATGQPATDGEVSVVDTVLTTAREDTKVHEWLETLTRRFGPRLTSSESLTRAQEWARDTFRSFGLEARLERWGDFPVAFERGISRGRMISPEELELELEFITYAWTPGTDGPERGAALLEPMSVEELDAMENRLAGAWLVRGPKGPGSELSAEIRKRGRAAGIAGYVRSAGRGDLMRMGGNYRVDPDDLPEDVVVRLISGQQKDLVGRLENGEEVELEFEIENRFGEGPVDLYNVIADLPGGDLAHELVIVQAHIDSWDGAEGALDNGTGVATTLEAARLLTSAGARPRRTIRFILYSGEEQGLFGSSAYVRDHREDLERVSIVLNHDNGTNHLAGIQATPAMLEDFEAVFAPLFELDPERPFVIEEVEKLRGASSDHKPFLDANVPAFHWNQNGEGYSYVHHTQHDRFPMADLDEQRHSSMVVAVAAINFANLDHLIDRTAMRNPNPRRMGVMLDREVGTLVTRVVKDGRASQAGWQPQDRIVAIDGVAVTGRRGIVAEMQKGGPKKRVQLLRGEETIETVLDYTDDPDEPLRQAEAERKAAKAALEAAAKKEPGDEPEGAKAGDR